MNYAYGYRLIDGRVTIGASIPNGGFVPQVSEMQPRGHWLTKDGQMLVGRPAHTPAWITRWLALRLHGDVWVHYDKTRPALEWV